MPGEEWITIEVDGEKRTVGRDAYARLQLKTLRGFGYPSLKLKDVQEQIGKIIAGEPLSVIGHMMASEIVLIGEDS